MSYKIIDIKIPVNEIGQLEAKYYMQENPDNHNPLVILFSPNPKFGATMNNNIITLLNKTFLKFNFNVIKFNYRGVGRSQGTSNADISEVNDGLAIIDWYLKKKEMGVSKAQNIWLAGYGFGAYLVLQIAMRRPEINGFVSLALPINKTLSHFNMLTPFPNGLIIHGDSDITCSAKKVESFYKQLITQQGCAIEFIEQKNDHYFTNQTLLENDLLNFLSKHFMINEIDNV